MPVPNDTKLLHSVDRIYKIYHTARQKTTLGTQLHKLELPHLCQRGGNFYNIVVQIVIKHDHLETAVWLIEYSHTTLIVRTYVLAIGSNPMLFNIIGTGTLYCRTCDKYYGKPQCYMGKTIDIEVSRLAIGFQKFCIIRLPQCTNTALKFASRIAYILAAYY